MYADRVEFADLFEHCRMDNDFEPEELSFKCCEDLIIHTDITSNFIWK